MRRRQAKKVLRRLVSRVYRPGTVAQAVRFAAELRVFPPWLEFALEIQRGNQMAARGMGEQWIRQQAKCFNEEIRRASREFVRIIDELEGMGVQHSCLARD